MIRLIGSFFTPTPLIVTLTVIGIILFLRHKKSAKYFLLTSTTLLLFFSTNPVPEFLLNYTEMKFPAFEKLKAPSDISHVLVLAGNIVPYDKHPITTQTTTATLVRVIEGIRIHRLYPGSKLVFTGKGINEIAEADMMKELAVSLGVRPEDILTETESLNTHDHTRYLKNVLLKKNFVLVTSALHMPRAMRLFQTAGYTPFPAPTQHILTGRYQIINFNPPYPVGENLYAMDAWFKEFWATRLAEIRGQI